MMALIVEPGENARPAEIGTAWEGMAHFASLPLFEDPDAVVIYNPNGKIRELPLNRIVPHTNIVINGPFIVCGETEDGYCDLTDQLLNKYYEIFRDPCLFYETPEGVYMQRCTPEKYQQAQRERKEARRPRYHPEYEPQR